MNTLLENIVGAATIAATVVLSPLLRPWYRKWGATAGELGRKLSGDALVPHPKLECTRAITIAAPPNAVWPWLMQMGQGRGGLYSFDGLENLAGCNIHSADRVLPEHQRVQPGDLIRLGPSGYPCFAVAAIEPGRALVLRGADPKTGQSPPSPLPETYVNSTWAFVLEKTTGKTTRLVIRSRTDWAPRSFGSTLIWRVFTDPIAFVMERQMLRGIKRRAEKGQ